MTSFCHLIGIPTAYVVQELTITCPVGMLVPFKYKNNPKRTEVRFSNSLLDVLALLTPNLMLILCFFSGMNEITEQALYALLGIYPPVKPSPYSKSNWCCRLVSVDCSFSCLTSTLCFETTNVNVNKAQI